MGTIIIIVLIATAAWFFLSGTFNTNFKDTETLRDNELENAFIELKKKILITSAYEKEKTYEHLYNRIRDVLNQILMRHEHFTIDLDAQGIDVRKMLTQRKNPHSHSTSYNDFFFPSDLPLDSFQSEELLYMCFYLYMGGRIQNVGSVEGNPQTMMKILNYLISERDFPPAYFFKGFVMKYGSEACGSVKISEARELLTLAQKKGVGAATIELKHLDSFAQLEHIENVHPKQFHQP